jgi:hypothetical protein
MAAGVIVLAGLVSVGAVVAPVYFRNRELERSLEQSQPVSDEALRRAILDKGRSLGLDIAPDHVQIRRVPGAGRAEVRYVIRVTFPLYTLDLHFSSSVPAPPQ